MIQTRNGFLCAAVLAAFVAAGCSDDDATGPAADTTPPAAVQDLTVDVAARNALSLAWTAPGEDGAAQGAASVYDLRWATVEITDETWDDAEPVTALEAPAEAGTAESLTVAGLDCGTTYHFALKSADEEANWSALSNVATAATLPNERPNTLVTGTPPGVLEDPQSVALYWTGSDPDGWVTGFRWQWDGETQWHATAATDTAFHFDEPGPRIFAVVAVDNDDEADLTPATFAFTVPAAR